MPLALAVDLLWALYPSIVCYLCAILLLLHTYLNEKKLWICLHHTTIKIEPLNKLLNNIIYYINYILYIALCFACYLPFSMPPLLLALLHCSLSNQFATFPPHVIVIIFVWRSILFLHSSIHILLECSG